MVIMARGSTCGRRRRRQQQQQVTQHGGYTPANTCRLTETMMQPRFIASFFDIGHLGYSQLKKEIMHADWFKIILIYILMIKNMFSVFLSIMEAQVKV